MNSPLDHKRNTQEFVAAVKRNNWVLLADGRVFVFADQERKEGWFLEKDWFTIKREIKPEYQSCAKIVDFSKYERANHA